MHDQCESIVHQSDASEFDNEIPDVLDSIEGEAIDVVCDEPLEDPHGLVQHQGFVEVIVQFAIEPFQHLLEDGGVDVCKGKAVLVEAED